MLFGIHCGYESFHLRIISFILMLTESRTLDGDANDTDRMIVNPTPFHCENFNIIG